MPQLPELLEQLDRHFGLSISDKKFIEETRIKYNVGSTENLKQTVEGNKQSLVHILNTCRELSMKIIIIESMIREREELKK